ncbi:hypothetical protein ACFV2X_07875 [Streptomyces sp. NPDC059679]|uniref:hypothetical protein n=1 Tax=Streptomyces sp. NPDC059679 TaxID=3346903 RepID=UPI0036B65688
MGIRIETLRFCVNHRLRESAYPSGEADDRRSRYRTPTRADDILGKHTAWNRQVLDAILAQCNKRGLLRAGSRVPAAA